jgi:hypothetical protein
MDLTKTKIKRIVEVSMQFVPKKILSVETIMYK